MIYDDEGNPIDYQFLKVNKGFSKITGLETKIEDNLKKRSVNEMAEVFQRKERRDTMSMVEDARTIGERAQRDETSYQLKNEAKKEVE